MVKRFVFYWQIAHFRLNWVVFVSSWKSKRLHASLADSIDYVEVHKGAISLQKTHVVYVSGALRFLEHEGGHELSVSIYHPAVLSLNFSGFQSVTGGSAGSRSLNEGINDWLWTDCVLLLMIPASGFYKNGMYLHTAVRLKERIDMKITWGGTF